MKKIFSNSWKSSKQPRKQRKYRAKAPLHIKHKMMSANLDKELRKKYSKKSFPVKKGDLVKIMRGKFKGKTGKINKVNLRKLKISIEGMQTQKKDGTKINVYFDPSNVQIKELDLKDSRRERKLKSTSQNKTEKIKEKTTGEKNVSKKK
ncbi:MAG: 50S ribosomal protein L24 [Nanoarchaeota archaeon]|nr:50S ribosomal protein L24 [Nanoarchaeota archaeon]